VDTKSNPVGEIELHQGEIKLVSIKKLKARTGNRNSHNTEQIDQLVKVYKAQGFRNPIIVSNQSGEIVCGTGRYLAAKKVGLKEVPVIYQDYASPELEYAHHIADNSLAKWSDLDLSGINADLEFLGPELNLDLLSIRNFELEPADKPTKSAERIPKPCPNCGYVKDEAGAVHD